MNENVLSQPWMSWSTLGHAFWRSTRIPSRTGSVHERTFGIPSTCIRQFGHAPVMQNRPRARWYLNERPVIETPAAASAEPIVSPSNAPIVRPSKRERDRPVAPDGLAGTRWEPFGHAVEASSTARRRRTARPSPSPGQNVRRTSFVPVCRSARNHFRHPSRCSHHSVCQPLTFSRKNR